MCTLHASKTINLADYIARSRERHRRVKALIECYTPFIQAGMQFIRLHHVIINPDGTRECSCESWRKKSWKKKYPNKPYKPCKSIGKHPLQNAWQANTISNLEKLSRLIKKFPDSNWGIVTGKRSGFWVLDVDSKNKGLAALAKMIAEEGELLETFKVITGGITKDLPDIEDGLRGYHFYFRHPGGDVEIPCWSYDVRRTDKLGYGPGLDIKGDGGFVVAPLSRHGSGLSYEPVMVQGKLELSAAPDFLLEKAFKQEKTIQPIALTPEMLDAMNRKHKELEASDPFLARRKQRYNEVAVERGCERIRNASAGGGFTSQRSVAFSLGMLAGGNDLDETYAISSMLDALRARGGEDREVMIRTCFKAGKLKPRGMPDSLPQYDHSQPKDEINYYFEMPNGVNAPVYAMTSEQEEEIERHAGPILAWEHEFMTRAPESFQAWEEAQTTLQYQARLDSYGEKEPEQVQEAAQAVQDSAQAYFPDRAISNPPTCPEPGSELSPYQREVLQGGRLFACDQCRYKKKQFACQDCGKKVGVRRTFPGEDPCQEGPKILMTLKSNVRQGIVIRLSCNRWSCRKCGWRKEFDHLCHFMTWGADLKRGILSIPSPDIKSRERIREHVSKKAYRMIVPKRHKALVSNFMSKLRRKYGVRWLCCYLGHERFAFLCLVPIKKVGNVWKRLKPSCLNYLSQRGKHKGLAYSALTITMDEFEETFRNALATAGNSLKLDRDPFETCDSTRPVRKHPPLTYCNELRPPKRNTKSNRYDPVGRIYQENEDFELISRGARLEALDPSHLDQSGQRGFNMQLWRATRFEFPESMPRERVKAILNRLVEKPTVVPALHLSPDPRRVGRDCQIQPSMFL